MAGGAVEVDDLSVWVNDIPAVDRVSFRVEAGQRLGLIGESGCGKTLTALSIMGLLPEGVHATGSVTHDGTDILALPEQRMARLRGDRLGMVFQEPMTALNPVARVGDQVAEVLRIHRGYGRRQARGRALALLERVQMPDAADKVRAYPHQLSGGQRQRAILAMAIACGPDLLIADEPTTALDVTVQAQILVLLDELVAEHGMSLLLITHDLPVVASVCEQVLVMYGGRIVETGPTGTVFAHPRHPYTAGLVGAVPEIALAGRRQGQRLQTVPGTVPSLGGFPDGCVYRDRCERADEWCRTEPRLAGHEQPVACWHPVDGSGQ